MLHYYFRTKEQLFERILDEKTRLMSQSVLTGLRPAGPASAGTPSGTASRATSTLSRRIPTCRASSSTRSFRVPSVTKRCAAGIRIIAEGLMHDIQQELDASAARGETEPVDARMLLLDIISLNVFPFIGFHIIEPVFGDLSGDRERFFEMRRAENVEIILRRLKKA